MWIRNVYQKVDDVYRVLCCAILQTGVCPKKHRNQLPGSRKLQRSCECVAALLTSVAPSATKKWRKKSPIARILSKNFPL